MNCIRCSHCHNEILRYIKMLISCWRWQFARLFSVTWLLCHRYGRFFVDFDSVDSRVDCASTRSRLGRFCRQCVRGLRFGLPDLASSHWVHSLCLDYFVCVRLFSCIISAFMLYYCNTVRWAWLDWGLSGWLTTLLQCFDTVGWVIRPVKI